MRSFFTGLAAIAVLLLASTQAQSQCSYYYGECYPNWMDNYSVQQGNSVYIEYFMYIYYGTWPDATFPVEISTDDGSSWTTLEIL